MNIHTKRQLETIAVTAAGAVLATVVIKYLIDRPKPESKPLLVVNQIGGSEALDDVDGPPSIGHHTVGYMADPRVPLIGYRVMSPREVAAWHRMTLDELRALNPTAFAPGAWRAGLVVRVYYWPVDPSLGGVV